MKLLVIAGPPSVGKTSLTKQIIKHFQKEIKIAYLKIDVVKAFEDIELRKEFKILTKKVYSGDLCPDHAGVMIMGDAIEWAESNHTASLLSKVPDFVSVAPLTLTKGLGIIVLSSIA